MTNIDKNVRFLGLNSFFTDISTEMILPLLPIFLDKFLQVSKADIGLIEGLAEFSAAILIALSGFYSDKIGARKNIALFGYSLSNLTKPLMLFANSFVFVMFVRIMDRVGKGIRTAPRDALIASYSDKSNSGKSFGFHKMMDSGGALVGSLAAFGVLVYFSENENAFRIIFALSLIPGILAFVTLAFFVKDATIKHNINIEFFSNLKLLGADFYRFVAFQTLFALVAMNYSFYILKAEHNGFSISMIPLVYALYNIAQSLPALKIGSLSDRYGKRTMLLFAYFSFCTAALFFMSNTLWGIWAGFAFYGLFAANFSSMSKAIIADMVETDKKATAYGVYFSSIGLATFISLFVAGIIWDKFGADTLFELSFTISSLLLFIAVSIKIKKLFS